MKAGARATVPRDAAAPVRAYRLTRAALHVVEGLATTAFVFPFASDRARKRTLERYSAK